MEFNHHHHHHHHHKHHDEHEEINHPPPGLTHPHPHPPPPAYAAPVFTQPAPSPYPPAYPPAYPSPYPPADVTQYPPRPAYVDLITHASVPDDLLSKPTFRIFSKAGPDYSLSIRNGDIVLALTNPQDVYQHWYKDQRFSTRVQDSEGSPAFTLINKGTGEAIKHAIGSTQPIRLIHYEPAVLDVEVLWTESRDLGDGYRAIRKVDDVNLNLDAYHGDRSSGGVHEGTTVVLWEWKAGDNQHWKIFPF
ncbi:PREDICTED: tripartite motif-containing protein 66-like [Lupinus angustifolius]|uniref:tripartite motif-containing protein 66-like n=1 Tax=Lupinus angustifolius TaxID=3871 RepID=UPI00092F0D4E|nr:PREDICTED: tripartite motif-containing protein 66-like [Lupinus angustifolius]